MHAGPFPRHLGGDHPGRRAFVEQRLRELAHRLVRRALAHADQHHSLAHRHDVAALQLGGAPVAGRWVTPPHLEITALEFRVVLVDGRQMERFLATCRPVHRIDRHTVVDPTRAVAREQLIRERRHHEIRSGPRLPSDGAVVGGEVVDRYATDEQRDESGWLHLVHPRPQLSRAVDPHLVGGQPLVEQVGATLRIRDDVGEQFVDEHDLNPELLPHEVDESVVPLAGLPHPDHVVEQELLRVRRCEPLHLEPGTVDDDLPELADLRVHTELSHGIAPFRAVDMGHQRSISDRSHPLWTNREVRTKPATAPANETCESGRRPRFGSGGRHYALAAKGSPEPAHAASR